MSDNIAILDGYTKEIEAVNRHGCEFFLLVQPNVDLSGAFTAWDTDEQEYCLVKPWEGWQITVVDTRAVHIAGLVKFIADHGIKAWEQDGKLFASSMLYHSDSRRNVVETVELAPTMCAVRQYLGY